MARKHQQVDETPEQKAERVARAWVDTFDQESGEIVLEELRVEFDGPSYVIRDTHQTAYHEGRRSVYHAILRTLEAARNGGDTGTDSELERTDGKF